MVLLNGTTSHSKRGPAKKDLVTFYTIDYISEKVQHEWSYKEKHFLTEKFLL